MDGLHVPFPVSDFYSLPSPCPIPSSPVSNAPPLQEQYVLPYFVEDRGPGLQSYTEHLCYLHRAVMSKA